MPVFYDNQQGTAIVAKVDSYEELEAAIDEYIDFYNTKRLQRKLKGMTPIEYRSHTLSA